MSRIAATFERLEQGGKKAVIPYIVAGDPEPGFTVEAMHGLVKAGADIIELGVPFSDPMAEGPVIQLAHERALEHNVSLRDALGMVSRFRETDKDTPVVLMGYANPVEVMGYQAFADAAASAGVDGLLTVDLPPEEGAELNRLLAEKGLDTIFLIAPTTVEERVKQICDAATGYLYYVSLKGVTGASHLDIDSVNEKMALIRRHTQLPISVGFGIKDAESACAVGSVSDGVVIGSAIVKAVNELAASGEKNAEILASPAVNLINSIRTALDNA